MALQMPTNIMPDVFAGVGGANFDASKGLNVSWQVNGSPFMLAYRITINKVDDNSTQLYTTGKVTLPSPFYGVLADGTVQMFSANTITASELSSAGIVNGNEYKVYITQWWGNTDSESITQQSASIIRAISSPTVTINEFPNPITQRMYTFIGDYSQPEGDGIAWVRWILYNYQTDNIIVDTGEIYGTSQLQFDYDAFFAGNIYGLEVIVETQAGQQATSGIQTINVSYPISSESGTLIAQQLCNWNGVSVSWEPSETESATGYSLYRLDETENLYKRIVDLGISQTSVIDYSAKNNHIYTYQVWETSDTAFVQQPITSNKISPCRWNVLLIAAQLENDGAYHPQAVYVFGSSVETGEETNNSKSSILDTYTGYPAYQQSSNIYRSGRLTAYVGKIDPSTNAYVNDTSDYVDEIMRLSISRYTLFLRDIKGNFRQVKINGSITQKTQSQWPNQASNITIPWVEVADASSVNVVLTNADDMWPYDAIADTTVMVELVNGHLHWQYPDDYLVGNKGSVLSIDENGHLLQTYTGTTVQMADMSIDNREHLVSSQ